MIKALVSRPLIAVAALLTTGTAGIAGVVATPAGAHLIGHTPSPASSASASRGGDDRGRDSDRDSGRDSGRDSDRTSGRGHHCRADQVWVSGRCDAPLQLGPAFSGTNMDGHRVDVGLNFQDLDTTATKDYVVAIGWGDGTGTVGKVTTFGPNSFVAQGTHQFRKAGDYWVTISVTPKDHGTSISDTFSVTAAGAPSSR